jgi:bifunctional N-acetylglucosamine-1-phosphate-uridyltransferase/glucosamine-1-phosphate-acetyltransferase GlmU-like protein
MIFIRTFENAVYWVVQDIDDYEKLKRSIQQNLYDYVKDQQLRPVEMNADIKNEDEAQRKYLADSMKALKARNDKVQAIHQEDHKKNMGDNTELIGDIL